MMLREKNGKINIRVNRIIRLPTAGAGGRLFDLQALRNSADNKPSRSLSRREAYVPQTA